MDIDIAGLSGSWLQGLRHAVAEAPEDDRAATAQEALDIVAAAVGLKPAAIVGRGRREENLMAAVRTAAMDGLIVADIPGWLEPIAALPAWYAALLHQAAAKERLLLVGLASRRDEWQQLSRELPDAFAVARGLGYPSCCVAEFHRRREGYHLISIDMLARQTAGDVESMRRLARANVLPAPLGDAELRAFLQATRTVFAPFTSIAMCGACERDPNSPARRIGADFARLAKDIGFDVWLIDPA